MFYIIPIITRPLQMGKQTMGTPAHTIPFRTDNKMYKLQVCIIEGLIIFKCYQTPQAPMVRPYLYDYYKVDNYPLGTNAIVAVISYTVNVL